MKQKQPRLGREVDQQLRRKSTGQEGQESEIEKWDRGRSETKRKRMQGKEREKKEKNRKGVTGPSEVMMDALEDQDSSRVMTRRAVERRKHFRLFLSSFPLHCYS